jgi:hypothetical protein
MEQQIQATVVSVESREARRKADNVAFTLYDVKLSDGEKYTTSRRETAEQAHSLTGKPALVTIKVEQNGQYTNRYINSIVGAMGSFMQPEPTFAPPPNGFATNGFAPATTTIPDTTADRETSIYRQVATKVAATISQTPHEFWRNVDELIFFYQTGNKPSSAEVFGTIPAPEPVAATTSDIPF